LSGSRGTSPSSSNKHAPLKRLVLFPSDLCDLNVAGLWGLNLTELEAKRFRKFTVQPRVNETQRWDIRIKTWCHCWRPPCTRKVHNTLKIHHWLCWGQMERYNATYLQQAMGTWRKQERRRKVFIL